MLLFRGLTALVKYRVSVTFHKDFVKVEGTHIYVGLKSKPKKGKANADLVKKLAKYFGIPSSRVKIISGFKSREKVIEIRES
ncbi:DUF167 domain-containing protein [Candidatus Bathyarchaeota archaeon]|nr:MAG: DUF167 domain-containing protein [Candidatus Bathyarchaeota archaeon]